MFFLLGMNCSIVFNHRGYFVCLRLSSERAASSPSESAVIVTSVIECLRYCIAHHTDEDEDQKELRSMLILQKVCSFFLGKRFHSPCCFYIV